MRRSVAGSSFDPDLSAADPEQRIAVITLLKQVEPKALISIDTYKASVARAAVEAGAEIVNDISGFASNCAVKAGSMV